MEVMDVGKSLAVILSLTLNPLGAEKFRMILAVPFSFILHSIDFDIFWFADRIVQSCYYTLLYQHCYGICTSVPKSCALGALVLKEAFLQSPLQWMSAPFSKSLHTASSLARLLQVTTFAPDRSYVADTGEIPNCFDYEQTWPRSHCLQ
jgi:hypothetical protein